MSSYDQGYQAGKNFIQLKAIAVCPEGSDPVEWQQGFQDALEDYSETENQNPLICH